MIGVFGSAFNPPTRGHAFVIKQALGHFDRIIANPSYDHCFGKQMAPYEVRLALAQAMVRDLGDPRVTVSDIERSIWSGGPVSSLEVLRALQAVYPDEQLTLIIGPDNAASFRKFRNHDIIKRDFGVYIAEEASDYPRATEIRRRIASSEDIQGTVTPGVAALLKDNHQHFAGI